MSPRRRARRFPLLAALLAAGLAAGCGGRHEKEPDRSNFLTVFHAAMKAVSEGDLHALWPLLSEEGQIEAEKSLKDWQQRLRDPHEAEWVRKQLRTYHAEVSEADLQKARDGSLQDVLALLVKADPRSPQPRLSKIEASQDQRRARILYETPRKDLREVTFVHTPSGWFIDKLGL